MRSGPFCAAVPGIEHGKRQTYVHYKCRQPSTPTPSTATASAVTTAPKLVRPAAPTDGIRQLSRNCNDGRHNKRRDAPKHHTASRESHICHFVPSRYAAGGKLPPELAN